MAKKRILHSSGHGCIIGEKIGTETFLKIVDYGKN